MRFTALLLVLAASCSANADIINYGDFVGDTVNYFNVTEISGESGALYGAPTITGDALTFTTPGFVSESLDGNLDFMDGRLQFEVTAVPGQFIESLTISESGSYSVLGDASLAEVTALAFVESDGVLYEGSFSFSQAGTGSGQWMESLTISFPAATSVTLVLDNILFTFADDPGMSSIDKQGLTITPNIPAPSAACVLVIGALGLSGRRRRSRDRREHFGPGRQTARGGSRLHRNVPTVAALLVLATAYSANAGTINYGDFVGSEVTYNAVTESSSEPGVLYGAPTITGNQLRFITPGFISQSENGGVDLLEGRVTFELVADGDEMIDELTISEQGVYFLFGPNSMVSVDPIASVEIGTDVYNGSFTVSEVGSAGTSSGLWQESFTISFPATSSLTLVLDNSLFTGADDPGVAFVDKKGLRITPHLTLNPTPTCPADLDGSGMVEIADLLLVLGAWGTPGGDVDADGTTNVQDLLALLSAWGACP